MSKEETRPMELARLLDKVCEEQLSEPEQRQLNELLRGSEEARRQYLAHINMHAALSYLSGLPEVRFDQNRKSPPPAGKSPVLGFLGECFNQGASFLWKSNVFSILVAVGLPMAMLALVFVLVYETPPSPVAVIARSRDCAGRIDDQPMSFYPGSNLFEKHRLAIDKGLVEIQFADGAVAVLEGPATFEILGGNGGSLTRGRLAAVVPPEARGFAVETPSARVVDLGTEFGVWVDDGGRVEAHVFGGQVEVVMPPKSADSSGVATLLTEGEAVRITAANAAGTSSKIARIPVATQQFKRSVALPEPTILFAHHGSADPTKEGWTAHFRRYGEGLPRNGVDLGSAGDATGPVDDGEAAWSFRPGPSDRRVFYEICDTDGLTPELQARAREKGWVLRARVRITAAGDPPTRKRGTGCNVMYRDAEGEWRMTFVLDPDGNQSIHEARPGTEGADSRNQYVDYELRYQPTTGTAELFANGRHVGSSNVRKTAERDKDAFVYPVLRFGGSQSVLSEARFAKVEWGILDDAAAVETQPQP